MGALCSTSPRQEFVEISSRGTLLDAGGMKLAVQQGPLCIHNSFCTSPSVCKAQAYCASPADITKEWLSGALNAEVLSFDTIVCGQGQCGLTVILQNIEYRDQGCDRPASVALKMHCQSEAMLPIIRMLNLYSRELFFYTSFQDQVAMKSPKVLGVWTDANGADLKGQPVEAFNLIMENLGNEWECFDTVTKLPTLEEFKRILLGAVPLHVKFWKKAEIYQKPFTTLPGGRCDYLETMKPLRPMAGQFWPLINEAMPRLSGWGEWPREFKEMLDFIDFFARNFAEYECMCNTMDEMMNTRPMTLVHGDLNAGNVWKKSSGLDEQLMYADWQMFKMAPAGYDLGTMLVVLSGGPNNEEMTDLFQTYHNALPTELRKEYTYVHMCEDFKCQIFQLMFGILAVMMGQLDPSSMDASKFEFTWKSYWPSVWRRLLQLFEDQGIDDFSKQLLGGRQ